MIDWSQSNSILLMTRASFIFHKCSGWFISKQQFLFQRLRYVHYLTFHEPHPSSIVSYNVQSQELEVPRPSLVLHVGRRCIDERS